MGVNSAALVAVAYLSRNDGVLSLAFSLKPERIAQNCTTTAPCIVVALLKSRSLLHETRVKPQQTTQRYNTRNWSSSPLLPLGKVRTKGVAITRRHQRGRPTTPWQKARPSLHASMCPYPGRQTQKASGTSRGRSSSSPPRRFLLLLVRERCVQRRFPRPAALAPSGRGARADGGAFTAVVVVCSRGRGPAAGAIAVSVAGAIAVSAAVRVFHHGVRDAAATGLASVSVACVC